jgi:hypothetical protein
MPAIVAANATLEQLIEHPELMCARYHWTVKPYWVIALRVVLVQSLIDVLSGNKKHWLELGYAMTTRERVIMAFQVAAICWAFSTIYEEYAQEGASDWENFCRYCYLMANSAAGHSAILLNLRFLYLMTLAMDRFRENRRDRGDEAPEVELVTAGASSTEPQLDAHAPAGSKDAEESCGNPVARDEAPGDELVVAVGASSTELRLAARAPAEDSKGGWEGKSDVLFLWVCFTFAFSPLVPGTLVFCWVAIISFSWVLVILMIFAQILSECSCMRPKSAMIRYRLMELAGGFGCILLYCSATTWGILLYRGQNVWDIVEVEWFSHGTIAYMDCVRAELGRSKAALADFLLLFF